MRKPVLVFVGALVIACGGAVPTSAPITTAPRPSLERPSPSVSAATPRPASSGLTELPRPKATLAPGRYTKSGFTPAIGFTIGDGWSAQQVARGFFDIQRDPDTPDVIAVQFANVTQESFQEAINAVTSQPYTRVVQAGEASVDGRPGFAAVIETTDDPTADPPVFRTVLDTTAGPISIASGRRLKVILVEVSNGVLGVLIGGSVAKWDDALAAAQPVVDSITIAD